MNISRKNKVQGVRAIFTTVWVLCAVYAANALFDIVGAWKTLLFTWWDGPATPGTTDPAHDAALQTLDRFAPLASSGMVLLTIIVAISGYAMYTAPVTKKRRPRARFAPTNSPSAN
ncbi:MAG: hypothetical protein ACAH35_05655 [Candidatus Paceibacterota bacterium]